MVRYLIQRPVAVLMTFTVLIIAGLALIKKIPISLLPDLDVPRIVVRVNYSGTSASVLEQNIIRRIREHLVNVTQLSNIESRSANHIGLIHLTFEYGTKMDLAYIEVNEKLDHLLPLLPADMERPQVVRINTSDIPVIRLQVIPGTGTSLTEVSTLCEKVLKRRLEQIQGVSLVDMNGKQQGTITITPKREVLQALNMNEGVITQTIQNANRSLGNLSLKDGQYRYFVTLHHSLDDKKAIDQLPVILKDGSVITLNQVATVQYEPAVQTGHHLYNGKEGLVITIQKQPSSRMNELVPKIKAAANRFKKDYPHVNFALSQDQTFLLDAAIANLNQDLLYGGLLTILLLFMFLGNWASPTLMGISIPVSLIISFAFFYLLGVSFNMISLSGLALGIGMLIDNSIVVIDNITRKRRSGLNMIDSSVTGTNEVITPVISQVLTTVSVYAPLVLFNGIAGSLIFDQSIALTISLGISLLVAFILTPLLYKLFLKTPPEKLKEDTIFYRKVWGAYHAMIHHILRHKRCYFIITILLMPTGIWLAAHMPVSALPNMEIKESLVSIDWNDPVDAQENLTRIQRLHTAIAHHCEVTEAEIGIKQFLLQHENNTIQHAELFFGCSNVMKKQQTGALVRQWILQHYPATTVQIADAPNAFTQLFSSTAPWLEARFKPATGHGPNNEPARMNDILQNMPVHSYKPGPGLINEPAMQVSLNASRMAIYGISKQQIEDALKQQFGAYAVSEIKRFGDVKTIYLATDRHTVSDRLATTINGQAGTPYPLNYFVSFNQAWEPKFITADKSGEYKSVCFERTVKNIDELQSRLTRWAANNGCTIEFSGEYFENKKQLNQLFLFFLIVLLLLYFILVVQYENLVQPLIVMSTIPLGIAGGMFLLWISGYPLDIMGAIGFIVVLGLIVDDPILKIETLNRLEKQYAAAGHPFDEQLLEKMIHQAGDICLKPLLMVSLTTSIAMVPVLLVGGIGNDLQKPLALVIIGGLTIGTFFTTWFIPLAFWYVTSRKYKRRSKKPYQI